MEQELANWIIANAKNGFPVNKDALLYSVQKIVEKSKIKSPSVENKPGRKWFDSFLKRHPIVRQNHVEYVNKARAEITESKIRNWFAEITELLQEDTYILEYPERVWNMDETVEKISQYYTT